MSFLLENPCHPTAEMIYAGLNAAFPTLSRSTIYQALELFCEKGAAQKIIIGDGEMRFDANVVRHGHFRCVKCGVITDFDFPTDMELPLPKGDFHILYQHLFYQGVCPLCFLPG